MPITRRRRANPPEEPENNSNHAAEQSENAATSSVPEQTQAANGPAGREDTAISPPFMEQPQATEPTQPSPSASSFIPIVPSTQVSNGADHQSYTTPIEGGRRTARGELFRRPPQPPQYQPSAVPPVPTPSAAAPLQAPTHEISLPLGNLLHLAYNPGYTGSDEARSKLLNQLANESKAGGRARCWNCGSIAIAYDRWSTRSKTFGEIGIAFCEICGVWSVL